MRITALTPRHRRPSRVDLFLDGELRLTLALEVARQLDLRPGRDLDEANLDAILDADLRWRAREAALTLLGYRARTTAELRRRLLRKQFPSVIVDETLTALAGSGYLDDGSFAGAFVRDRLARKPRSRSHLLRELRQRGVPLDEAKQAVDAHFHQESVSEPDLARAAAESWLRRAGAGKDRPDARRRLFAFLARRGFHGDTARSAVDTVLSKE